MKSKFFKHIFSGCFALILIVIFSPPLKAQTAQVEPEVRDYVEQKAKKAEVPADINSAVRGDLNADGKEDVVIEYYVQIGYPGNLTNTYLTVFLRKNDKMTFVAESDARAVPARIENGILICDKYGEGAKKFDKVGTIRYKLVKQKLVEVKASKF